MDEPVSYLGGIFEANPAVASLTSPQPAFVHRDFQPLRRITLRVRTALPASGCYAAGADHKKRWSTLRKLAATCASLQKHRLRHERITNIPTPYPRTFR